MTAEEFLTRARIEISDNPKDRFTFLLKKYLEEDDCLIDIHTHIFDRKCLSVGYILLRLGKSIALGALGIEAVDEEADNMELLTLDKDELYERLSHLKMNDDEDWLKLEEELEKTIELNETYEFLGMDLKDALKVFRKKDMKEILEFYHDEFAITNLPEFRNGKMVTGILQMDLETGWGFNPKRNFKRQIDDIKELTRSRPIIPYLALDPRRVDKNGKDENLYELFLDVFTDKETPFFGVKCYPALGYFPSDVRLDPIFKICAEKKIPVLSHCGGETVSTFKKTIKTKDADGYRDFDIPGDNRKERARYLNKPEHWVPVLQKYPDLKLLFGHWGGDDNWLNYSKTGNDQRIAKIMEMMRDPQLNVFGDFSFNVVEEELFYKFKETMENHPELLAKTLYGTDYWVVLPAGDLLKMQDKFLKAMAPYHQQMLKENAMNYLLN